MTRYVQHQSGAGKMWEVIDEYDDSWRVDKQGTVSKAASHWLPKSEYVEVQASESRWVDVTAACEVQAKGVITDGLYHRGQSLTYRDYRLRKVKMWTDDVPLNEATKAWAFIVERREP